MAKTTLYIRPLGLGRYGSIPGTYAVTGGKVRYRTSGSMTTWIDSLFTEGELLQKVEQGHLVGPVVVTNFKEHGNA